MAEKKPANKKRKWLGLAAICLLGVAAFPLGAMLLNNQFISSQSNSLQDSPYFPEGTTFHEVSYVTSNRGDCFFFAGVNLCSDKTPEAILGNLEAVSSTLDYNHPIQNWSIAWAFSDSFAIHPIGLNTVYVPQPINIGMYGGDVNTGLEELFGATDCDKFHTVLFSTTTRSNAFDIRCY